MILGRVQGQVVSTIKHEAYAGHRILLLDRIDAAGKELGGYLVAIDAVGATVGQTVLVIDEGNSARQVLGDPSAPTHTVGLPAHTVGLPARTAGLPARTAGLPVRTAGLPVRTAGLPVRTAGLPVRTAGLPVRSVIVGIVDNVHMVDSSRS